MLTTPDDHFAASPDCPVKLSAFGRVSGAGGRPTIRARIVPSAGVQIEAARDAAPDDHFTASPDCGVPVSRSGGIGECRWSPRIIGAATRGTGYYRKLVGAVHLNRLGD
jgi:hypothetical protein